MVSTSPQVCSAPDGLGHVRHPSGQDWLVRPSRPSSLVQGRPRPLDGRPLTRRKKLLRITEPFAPARQRRDGIGQPPRVLFHVPLGGPRKCEAIVRERRAMTSLASTSLQLEVLPQVDQFGRRHRHEGVAFYRGIIQKGVIRLERCGASPVSRDARICRCARWLRSSRSSHNKH